jgi:hypothetical protein
MSSREIRREHKVGQLADFVLSDFWSGCPDLNRGPLEPHSSALAKLRHTPSGRDGRI